MGKKVPAALIQTTQPINRRFPWNWMARVLVLLGLVLLRWLAYRSAGGLWRDEAHSVDMAHLPTSELFFALTYDSFPMAWAVLLRMWIALCGDTDEALRLLGFLIGLAIIPTMWWTARQFGITFPWFLMILLGLDPNLIVFGGEVRGYGLGVLAFLVLIASSWNTLQRPSALRWSGLTLAAFLAVQSSYTNCFLLAATFIACGIVAIRRGRYRVCMGFMFIGVVMAVSMLPYGLYVFPKLSKAVKPLMGVAGWQTPINVFLSAFVWGGKLRLVLWPVIGFVSLFEIVNRLNPRQSRQLTQTTEEQDLSLFLPLFAGLGSVSFWFYIFWLGVATQEWYYLPWMTLLAVTTELCMALWMRQSQRNRYPLAFSMTIIFAIIVCEDIPKVRYRFTTIDLIARELNREVREGDLVVVIPWYNGTTFNRYYRGRAEWMNLPDVDRDRRHRGFEELKERVLPVATPLAIATELQKMEDVIRSGGRVWWLGPRDIMPKGHRPLELSGAPHPRFGWHLATYTISWMQLATSRMYQVGATPRKWIANQPAFVNPFENPTVYAFDPPQSSPTSTDSEKRE